MAACRRAGVRFAADDIGAGNAGLRLLSELEFDILKIDLSLVQRSESDGPSTAVIGSVVELATRTGALVVAEGIERSMQLMPLLRLGVTAGQGFYLGRPGPLEQAVEQVPRAMSQTEAVAGVAAWRQSIGLPIS
jgi:EAL domain-containing protein (putative c-di-GMP-specific phosphodiesterase class I)